MGPNLWDSSQYRLWDTTWDVRLGSKRISNSGFALIFNLTMNTMFGKLVAEIKCFIKICLAEAYKKSDPPSDPCHSKPSWEK